ncbi:6-phosphogluconolactonase [Treponema parvum]|uniref:6-phosphogluconolactonase n=1 Tax=Treponema parvum TaxID=138851 RepID=UPI001AEC55B0|nr:6-phosphogluconolactonase [Treponema parvum]QTQ15902.1 6-phosphogluconolactonase [Treponema parvum]
MAAYAPQGFGNYLKRHIFDLLPFKSVNYTNITAKDPKKEVARYESILKAYPIDICILGIGKNGHIAFNAPNEAGFNDIHFVKLVHLDDVCRQQQVNDGCFSNISKVPVYTIPVTILGPLRAKAMFCIVPTSNKANAVKRMLGGIINESCPYIILQGKKIVKNFISIPTLYHNYKKFKQLVH